MAANPTARARMRAVRHFHRHAGWSHGQHEDPKRGRRRSANQLAAAEAEGHRRGWHVNWAHSQEQYEMGDAETEMPEEVFDAVLYDDDGNVLSSLGQIGDPDAAYRRVVEAELMDEALANLGWVGRARQRRRF